MSAATPGQADDALRQALLARIRDMYCSEPDASCPACSRLVDDILAILAEAAQDDGLAEYDRARASQAAFSTGMQAQRDLAAAQEPHAASGDRSFEDMLADPREQFDLRSELLASISEYAAAPPASAGIKPWHPHGVPQPAPELAALRELLDEIGVMAANAPEDGDSFAVLEEIAMRIAAADVLDSAPPECRPGPENPVAGRTPGLLAEILGSFVSFGRHGQFRRSVLSDDEYQSWCRRAEVPDA